MAALNALKELPGDEPAKKKTSSSSITIERDRKALASKRTESDPFLGSTVQGGPPPIGNIQGNFGNSATSAKNGKLGSDSMVFCSPKKKPFGNANTTSGANPFINEMQAPNQGNSRASSNKRPSKIESRAEAAKEKVRLRGEAIRNNIQNKDDKPKKSFGINKKNINPAFLKKNEEDG